MSDTAVKSRCTSFFCLVTVKDRIYHHRLLHLSHKNLKHYHSKQKSRKPRYHPWPPTHCAYTTLSLHPNQLLSPAYLYTFGTLHCLFLSDSWSSFHLSISFCIFNWLMIPPFPVPISILPWKWCSILSPFSLSINIPARTDRSHSSSTISFK